MNQPHFTGVLAPRRRGWRGTARRLGAAFGMLALLLQCLAFTAHQSARAASPLPFDEPGAWCGMPDMRGPNLPDSGKAPLRGSLVCPICQSVLAGGAGLLPPPLILVAPTAVRHSVSPVADAAVPARHGRFSANPRGPPILL
ncbi:MAG TPA: DUF2946 family protein [Alphaproteobacteria bacterium]